MSKGLDKSVSFERPMVRAGGMRVAWAKAIGLLLLLQLSLGPSALAQTSGITSLFPPRPTGLVTDVASVIDPASESAITDLIERLRSVTGAEIAVVTLPTIGDYPESDVALQIGRAWGVGARAEVGDPRRNSGVVLLIVPRQNGRPGTGAVFIATGQGIEGMITDARAGQVRELMRPELSAERYGPAALTGTRALVSLIAQGFGVTDSALTASPPAPAPPSSGRSSFRRLLPLILVIIVILLSRSGGGGRGGRGRRRRRGGGLLPGILWGMLGSGGRGGGWGGGGGSWGGGFGGGGGGFGGFGGGGGFSGGGAGGRF